MALVRVIRPGFFSTIQDLGRPEYGIYGVNNCGAMDPFSLRIANLLVGNKESDAALEVTLIGPKLKFELSGLIAITGGNLSPILNNKSVSMWKCLRVKSGDILEFGKYEDGCRSYIAFSGGINVPKVMGSRSTYIRGGYGGLNGRQLKKGDYFHLGKSCLKADQLYGRKLRYDHIPNYKINNPIRVILGPHNKSFTEESLSFFFNKGYTISKDSDRMGYRLSGSKLQHIDGADIISDFTTMGAIQVPGNGQPIIQMADRGTTGGYTKIGVIISADITFLAQKKPGDQLFFEQIDVLLAQTIWQKSLDVINNIKLNNTLLRGL